MEDIKQLLKNEATEFEDFLAELLTDQDIVPELKEAMEYTLLSGGKRVRPVLTLFTTRLLGGNERAARFTGAALELIHTYSLIHDDLPAMDDDRLRRGKPTNHLVYGEGLAVLAGDGLLTQAFKILANLDLPAAKRCGLIDLLAEAAGPAGMVGGQALDLQAEEKSVDLQGLKKIHSLKTGALFKASVLGGAYCSEATPEEWRALEVYAEQLGLAFQIVDDILDVVGESSQLGKESGQDSKQGKSTYPALLGLEQAKQEAETARAKGEKALDIFGPKSSVLKDLLRYVVERQY
ncbi:MAG: polyprenyl synthetase family protein [Bacillota bacterium]